MARELEPGREEGHLGQILVLNDQRVGEPVKSAYRSPKAVTGSTRRQRFDSPSRKSSLVLDAVLRIHGVEELLAILCSCSHFGYTFEHEPGQPRRRSPRSNVDSLPGYAPYARLQRC